MGFQWGVALPTPHWRWGWFSYEKSFILEPSNKKLYGKTL